MRNTIVTSFIVGVLTTLSSGCSFDEGLIIENLKGTVRLPVEAATRSIIDSDGKVVEVQGPEVIGPVYLGLYPSIEPANVIERYPHPEVGPQFLDDVQGNAYPYGGTTIGDLRFACFESLSCKVTSGRFKDWAGLIDFFDAIGEPVLDNFGQPITNPELLRQTCYDLLDVTSDAEMRITAYEDRNDDGNIDELDLDFVIDDSGEFYEAEFTIWQQEFFYDLEQEDCTPGTDCKGMSLWGWMDAPGTAQFTFSTCDPAFGFNTEVYDSEFVFGSVVSDVLNFPSNRISSGDWVSAQHFQWDDVNDEPTLVLDFEVQ